MTSLFETKHPYTGPESCYWANGFQQKDYNERFFSWAEFLDSDWIESDLDYNLIYRWDWVKTDPEDYEPGEAFPSDVLHLFWMLQRKGIMAHSEIAVTEADEPAIREFLLPRWRKIQDLWAPFSGE